MVAGLAGISRSYLAMLERGERRFDRRGLLEGLAAVLGCSVVDLTGQPYPPTDRVAAQTQASVGEVSAALYDSMLTDMPADRVRPVAELTELAAAANRHTDESRYSAAAAGLGTVLTELHVHAVHSAGQRHQTLAALIEACWAATGIARQLGRPEVAVRAAQRAAEAASELQSEPLMAFTAMSHAGALARLGARRAARLVLLRGFEVVERVADPAGEDTSGAEGLGMLHLASAQLAAREGRRPDADTHLREARELATRTGERNAHLYHFGPANVTAWQLAIAVELDRGPSVAAAVDTSPAMFATLRSADRRAGFHLELARAWAQSGGDRDVLALRHLDAADMIAPQRLRNDPIARELVVALGSRAQRRSWELDSLRHRFGLIQPR